MAPKVHEVCWDIDAGVMVMDRVLMFEVKALRKVALET